MIGQQQSADGPRFLAANMSIAGPLDYPNRPCGTGTGDAYHQLVCAALDSGIVVAVAAANDHRVVNQRPAIYDEPITVGALADFDGKPGGRGRQKSICPWYSRGPGRHLRRLLGLGRGGGHPGARQMHPVDLHQGPIRLDERHVHGDAACRRGRRAVPDALPEREATAGDPGARVRGHARLAHRHAPRMGARTGCSRCRTFTPPPTFTVSAGTGLLGGAGTSRGIKISVSRKNGHYSAHHGACRERPRRRRVPDPEARHPRQRSAPSRLLGSDALSSGSYDVIVTASDGEVRATTTVRIRVDADAPDVTLTSPVAGHHHGPDGPRGPGLGPRLRIRIRASSRGPSSAGRPRRAA